MKWNVFLCFIFAAGVLGASPSSTPQPNIVVVVADDMRWGDSGTYGHELFQTPNMGRMASEGVKLTQCYSACGVCFTVLAVSDYELISDLSAVCVSFIPVLASKLPEKIDEIKRDSSHMGGYQS